MLIWLPRNRSRKNPTTNQRRRPWLEQLEIRDCPTGSGGPVLTNVSAVTAGPNQIVVSGMVLDPAPLTVTVTFNGVANGSTTPASDGTFSLTMNASQLGSESINAVDGQNLAATPVAVAVQDQGVTITNFTGVVGTGGVWIFTGTVSGGGGGPFTVTLNGVQGSVNATVNTDANGNFTYSIVLPATARGVLIAVATDSWGTSSDPTSFYVNS